MGRKIPAKKHRGVKDPLVQQARRLQSVKGKINAPPADPDEQPVPRSLLRLFAPHGGARARTQRPDHNKRAFDKSKGGVGANPVSRLRALAGESARDFSRRINTAVRALHAGPADLHYPLDDEDEEDSKGARMAELREKRARKQRRAAAGRGGGGGSRGAPGGKPEPALTRTQKLALKRKAKKENADEVSAVERRELVYERVAFGDVAHAPPALRPPRAAPRSTPRPAQRGLLLNAMLSGGGGDAGAGGGGNKGSKASLPAAEARRLERARQDAVTAYRALKATRANSAR